MKDLAQEIEQKQSTVQNAFKDYTNIPYYLHAILIHDGDGQ